MYSEKATKFCEISTLLLSYVVPVKNKVEISQNFVAFSEYMSFTCLGIRISAKLLNSLDAAQLSWIILPIQNLERSC